MSKKEGRKSQKVADLGEFWSAQDTIKLLDPNILACRDHIELLRQLANSKAKVDFTQGIDARLLNEENINALNQVSTSMIHFAWDSMEQSEKILNGLNLYSRLGNVDRWHRAAYVLTNKNTTEEEDLYRIYHLRDMDLDPYVMIYNKPEASQRTKDIQRWVNSKPIWRMCKRFEDYKARGG